MSQYRSAVSNPETLPIMQLATAEKSYGVLRKQPHSELAKQARQQLVKLLQISPKMIESEVFTIKQATGLYIADQSNLRNTATDNVITNLIYDYIGPEGLVISELEEANTRSKTYPTACFHKPTTTFASLKSDLRMIRNDVQLDMPDRLNKIKQAIKGAEKHAAELTQPQRNALSNASRRLDDFTFSQALATMPNLGLNSKTA